MLRFLRYLVEAVAACFGVAIVLGLLLIWRLSISPVSSDFLTPYIEAAIEHAVPGSKAHIDDAQLTWNGAERSVVLHADNLSVTEGVGAVIATVPVFEGKISILGLFFGQFTPRDLDIDHPQITLERAADGRFMFGGRVLGGGGAEKNTGVSLADRMRDLSHATWMRKLSATRVALTIHDDATQADWAVSVPEITLRRKILTDGEHGLEYSALEGNAEVDVTQKDSSATVNIHYAYDPVKQEHSLSASFDGVTPAFFAGGDPQILGLGAAAIFDLPLSGQIAATLDKNFTVAAADAHLHGGAGHLVYVDFWDQPCPVDSLDLDAAYDRAARTLSVSDTHIDLGGTGVDVDVTGVAGKTDKDIDYNLTLKITNFPMNSYGALWPKPLLPNPREWLAANLRDGVITQANIALNGAINTDHPQDISIDDGNGKVTAVNGRVTYMDGLPPVDNVSADATFDLKHMSVLVTSGNIGAITLSPFTVQITGLADDTQYIDIPAQISGPLPDIMRLLNRKPLEYAKAIGLSPDDITGKITGIGDFHFPLLKTLQMKDVSIDAHADAGDIASTRLVPGVAIDQGNLAVALNMSGLHLAGQADIDKIPFQIVWQENFEKKLGQNLRDATITGAVKDDQWNNFGINSFNGSKGPMNVTLHMTKPSKTKMILNGTLDMTPATAEVYALNWHKPAGVPATLKFTATAAGDKPVVVSPLILRGAQISADGKATLAPDMIHLLALDFSPFILGRTHVNLHFAQTYGADGTMSLSADGDALDVSGILSDKDPARADPRPKQFHMQVDKLYTSEDGEIDKAQGSASRDQAGWLAIDLHGLAGGDTPVSLQLTPQPDGHRTLSITSDDFGKAMQGLGFSDAVKGGKLSVKGASTVDEPRLIVGTADIRDFTVVNLPALALLLNATSPFGFAGIVTDSAHFSRFLGEFHWQGDDITLTQAHAAGSAIGINIDGKVNMDNGAANLQGTLVPFSVMNNMLNYLPIIGNIITGGDNQGVLAVSYQIKGTLAAPDISVNPVSLLTPGFIRNLFFTDDTADEPKPEN